MFPAAEKALAGVPLWAIGSAMIGRFGPADAAFMCFGPVAAGAHTANQSRAIASAMVHGLSAANKALMLFGCVRSRTQVTLRTSGVIQTDSPTNIKRIHGGGILGM